MTVAISEQGRMILVEFFEHVFHGGLPDKAAERPGTELPAVLVDGGKLTLVEEDRLADGALQGRFFFVLIADVHSAVFLSCHNPLICNTTNILSILQKHY